MTATVDISPREGEVLDLVGAHFSNAEIAARLSISVRTVESHVSSLLRKLDVPDRRALAHRAPQPTGAGADRPSRPPRVLPAPLTSFVGRSEEQAELLELIKAHREVTAVGPGGVGKTRLALAVAAEAAGDYADVWYVDLVPVTDPEMIATAVAGTLGLGEQPGRDMTESVIAALTDRQALLVLDNCEQVVDGVALFVERLLATCPGLTVLATSRAQLMVPFERVYQVPPLSLPANGESDAVALFLERAAAVGAPLDAPRRDQIAAICERLDGMALAIELAAARYHTLGLDGITAALSHPLRMLTGGFRADERHRSVRAALDWSHALIDPADQALLRRVSVFVAPFTVAQAAEVAESEEFVVADGLARLAEQSLLVVTTTPSGTAYRALETIREYATERLAEAGELVDARFRHLRWCLGRMTELAVVGPDWRARFDAVADDLRAALAWAAQEPEQRTDAYRLARQLAELTFTRTLIGESQQRYEQAASLADDPDSQAAALRQAAAVAACRMRGDDLYRLYRAAAEAAGRAGNTAGAARDLATTATTAYRFASKFVRKLPLEETDALVAQAQELAGDDPAARAVVAVAEAGQALNAAVTTVEGRPGSSVADTIARAEKAVELTHAVGDPLAESVALDVLTGALSWAGDTFAAAATTQRRIKLLSSAPNTPAATHELIEALGEAAEASLGTGDLPAARRWAGQLADHPLLAEVGHRATSWLLVADAFAGAVDQVLSGSVRFLDGWRRAGSPAGSSLGPAVAAVAMVHGLRGDDDARREWQEVLDQLGTSPDRTYGYGAVFDTMLLLHQGRVAEALERIEPDPRQVWRWVTWIWHHWYVALRAEAAVLAGSPDAQDRLTEARTIVAGNPVAEAMVTRAAAILADDREAVLATAAAFDRAGCPYQSARTLILAGGEPT
ncbi:LuxR C-terminal-related transcriptional regulator [Kribbella sp. CA-253562]|uniref:LuxR C-terminal-related transcriptional regulator n=1 Tax=Kribbella sp. CA-253562 TaxID=3239942 RepID=UPI003D90191B